MPAKALKKKSVLKRDQYLTDGKKLLLVLEVGHGKTWVEDAQTGETTERENGKLESWEVVKREKQ